MDSITVVDIRRYLAGSQINAVLSKCLFSCRPRAAHHHTAREGTRGISLPLPDRPQAEPFITPVDEQKFPNYGEFVACPMDLNTMEENIQRGQYGSTEAFIADCKWILHNCILFNGRTRRDVSATEGPGPGVAAWGGISNCLTGCIVCIRKYVHLFVWEV